MILFSLGGLSESGKSSVGIYLESLGFLRIKIKTIEKEMMLESGLIESESDATNENLYNLLYKNQNLAIQTFINKLEKKIGPNKYATIESIYRPKLHVFFKRKMAQLSMSLFRGSIR